MKAIYLLASFIFISAAARAQSDVSVVQLSKVPKATSIGYSKFGKLYALPQDNMPCIVPPTAIAALMPVVITPLLNARIPNAIPKQDLFAKQSASNNFFKLNTVPKENSTNLMLDLIHKK